MTKYAVHVPDQIIYFEAEDIAEADFLFRDEVECDSIDEE